jgi:beta-glucosidase
MVDIARDPRWGRISEGAGEDTWYGCQVARAMVRGYQGNDLSAPNNVMACVKHFALYGGAEAGRDYNTVDMSERRMFQDYLPPYKAAIDAGAGSVMSSFNEINGVPATANKWLMTDLLRKQWGFTGFVATDYTAVLELMPHGLGNEAEVAKLSLKAGIDMDMVSEFFLNNLKTAVKDGSMDESYINIACKRILEAKYKLGLFTDPYRNVSEARAKQTLMKPEFRQAAREIAGKSMVLLKKGDVLPLKKTGSIALIGPLARNQRDMIGSWSGAGDWSQAVSVEQGIRNVVGNAVTINYAKGANFTDDSLFIQRLDANELDLDKRPEEVLIAEAVQTAMRSDVVIAVVGESRGMTGEASSRSDIGLPGRQLDLLKALKKTGKPLVIVLMNGRPMTIQWESQHADAILEAWFGGTEAGNAVADILFGDRNPSGKLTATFPQNLGQVPIYYSHKNTGRPYQGVFLDKFRSRYLDVSNEPLYPFGFGLSYTTFNYGDILLNQNTLHANDSITASLTLTNSGKFDGEEVVQLYIQDLVGSVTRPVKELKGFKRVFLKAGQSQTVSFNIKESDLRFYDINMTYQSEPGDFRVFIGTNSRDVKEASFKLVK